MVVTTKRVIGVIIGIAIAFIFFDYIHKSDPEKTLDFYLRSLKQLHIEEAYQCIVFENGFAEPFESYKRNAISNQIVSYSIKKFFVLGKDSYVALVALTEQNKSSPREITFTLKRFNGDWKILFPAYKSPNILL
uniref:hypothetical protein n=1 Tax=Paenibacillus terrae TaxID=159743 RepID=UPI0011A213D3|nr:hypothetical protein [Paenibacillus terrae]